MDPQELKHCFLTLEINFTEEEINHLFQACEDMGIKFNDFIVLQFLVYLPAAAHSKLRMGIPKDLEATFETLVDTFVRVLGQEQGWVCQEARDGPSNKRNCFRGTIFCAYSPKRFEKMDWDKNGMVNFKEFLFAFTRWVGIDDVEDDDEDDGKESI